MSRLSEEEFEGICIRAGQRVSRPTDVLDLRDERATILAALAAERAKVVRLREALETGLELVRDRSSEGLPLVPPQGIAAMEHIFRAALAEAPA